MLALYAGRHSLLHPGHPVCRGGVEHVEDSIVIPLAHKTVLVLGLGRSGLAAAGLLRRCGARVVAVDSAETAELQREAAALKAQGITVQLGLQQVPDVPCD